MKNRWILAGLLVSLLALVAGALTACGGSSPLIGKWQYVEDEEMFIEFFKDGQVDMGDESNVLSGTYEETDDKGVTLSLEILNGEMADETREIDLEYSFFGDRLTLTDGNDPATFTRAE